MICLGGASQAFLALPAWAQENDPGFIRALGTDSASVENAYYLWATADNAPKDWLYSYGEGVFTLAKDFGLVLSFPNLVTLLPLGQSPLALAPTGLYLRLEPFHSGGWNSETAGVLSFQAGGAYGAANSTFRYIGSSWTAEALGGYKIGRFFLQGNYGFQGGIDPQALTQWQADTSLGFALGSNWYLQGEADFYSITAPFSDSSWSFLPQVAFQPGDWLFEFGESFSGDTPQGITEVLAARAF